MESLCDGSKGGMLGGLWWTAVDNEQNNENSACFYILDSCHLDDDDVKDESYQLLNSQATLKLLRSNSQAPFIQLSRYFHHEFVVREEKS